MLRDAALLDINHSFAALFNSYLSGKRSDGLQANANSGSVPVGWVGRVTRSQTKTRSIKGA